MKKKIILITLILVILVLVIALLFKNYIGKPLYEPGRLQQDAKITKSLIPPAQPDEANFWLVEPDIKLHFFSAGEGRKILMIHGGPGFPTSEPYPALAELTAYFKFYYYDQRGCGQSTHPIEKFESANFYKNMVLLDQKLGLASQIADIERIRQILGEEKIILMGHSFGAFLATLYAIEFPEHVKAMILIAPANLLVMPSDEPDLFTSVQKLLPDSLRAEYAQFMKNYLNFQDIFSKTENDLALLNRDFAKYYKIAASKNNSLAVIDTNIRNNGGWMVIALYFSMGKSHDYREMVKKVGIPTLVIHGQKDLQSENASRLYADLLPNSKFEVIPQAGHFPFYEQAVNFAKITGQFLKDIF